MVFSAVQHYDPPISHKQRQLQHRHLYFNVTCRCHKFIEMAAHIRFIEMSAHTRFNPRYHILFTHAFFEVKVRQ